MFAVTLVGLTTDFDFFGGAGLEVDSNSSLALVSKDWKN